MQTTIQIALTTKRQQEIIAELCQAHDCTVEELFWRLVRQEAMRLSAQNANIVFCADEFLGHRARYEREVSASM